LSIAWNDIVTAFIAAVAAGVSLFTFVYQYTLRPRLSIQIGQEILAHYTTNSGRSPRRLILTSGFVFLNKGAVPTAMVGLLGTLWPAGSSRPGVPNLVWEKYEKTERVNPVGGAAQYRTGSSGLVETIIISGRSFSPENKIRLYSTDTEILSGQVYTLELQAIDGSTRGIRGASLTCKLDLTENDATELERNGAEENGVFRSRIRFMRQITASSQRAKAVEFKSHGRWDIA
jgi:hypothetical protein